jgi:hypothetical protein
MNISPQKTLRVTIMKDQIQRKKSLGALRTAEKTKARSPDLTGQLHLQRHTLAEIIRQAKEADDDEVTCNLAAWRNYDKNGATYLSVELSPWYVKRPKQKAKGDVFKDLFGDGGE